MIRPPELRLPLAPETWVQVYAAPRLPSPPGMAPAPRRWNQHAPQFPDPADPLTEVQDVRGGCLVRRWERVGPVILPAGMPPPPPEDRA